MSKLLISGLHLLYSPSLAARIGRSEATFLQQSYYWMGVGGGKKINGVKWFWKTYRKWSEELSLSISTVRRAVSNLKKLGLISVERLAAKTWYQSNWYTVNIEAVKAFIKNEQIDVLKLDTSMCSNWTDHIKDYSPEEFSTQQHAAAGKDFVEENSEKLPKDVTTIEQTISTRSPSNVEQSTILPFVEEQNHSCSSTQSLTLDDLSSAALEPKEKISQEDPREICNQTIEETIEAVDAFIQNDQIDVLKLDTSMCSNWTDHIKDYSPEEFSTQQHAAAGKDFVEENSEKLPKDVTTSEQTISTRSPSNVEQSTILRFVEEQNHSCSSTQSLTDEDSSSAALEPKEKISQEELREICNQLRQIPDAPNFRLNQEIIGVINKFWRNVPGALAYLKEALRTWKRVNSPEAVFVAACKNGKKPENWGIPLSSYPQPSDEDLAQLAEAKLTGRIKDYYRQPDGQWVVDTGIECVGFLTYAYKARDSKKM